MYNQIILIQSNSNYFNNTLYTFAQEQKQKMHVFIYSPITKTRPTNRFILSTLPI